jgi:hypothetical protein
VKRVVYENVTINAKELLASRTFENYFVGVFESALTGDAVRGLIIVGNFYKMGNRKEMMV